MITYTAPPGTFGSMDQAKREAQELIKFAEANYGAYLRQFPHALEGSAQCVAPVDRATLVTAEDDDAGALRITVAEQPDTEAVPE